MNSQKDWAREMSSKGFTLKLEQSLNRFKNQGRCHPVAVWIVLLIIVLFWTMAAVMLVKHHADFIDGRPAVNVKLAQVV